MAIPGNVRSGGEAQHVAAWNVAVMWGNQRRLCRRCIAIHSRQREHGVLTVSTCVHRVELAAAAVPCVRHASFRPLLTERASELHTCASNPLNDIVGPAHRCLLIEPFPESALNEEAGKLLLEDYEGYAKHARLMTSIHALPAKR